MITADRDAANLLRAILDEPGEDLPRLAYADWLEEHGQKPWLARFIRHQMAGNAVAVPLSITIRLRHLVPGCTNVGDQGVARLSHPENGTLTFRRGFLDSVRLPLAAARDCLPALVSEHPLTRVEVTSGFRAAHYDRGPGFKCWALNPSSGEADRFYVANLSKHMDQWYDVEEYVFDALSDALLAWAKGQK